jgi:uncharacterized protein YraI
MMARKVLMVALAALLVVLSLHGDVFGQAAQSGTVNRTSNLRAGPGTNHAIIGRATPGQSVTVVGANDGGGWYQLAGGEWIAAFLVDVGTSQPPSTPPASSSPTAGAATTQAPASGGAALRNANLRAGPGTNYGVIGGVRAGQTLEIAGQNSDGSWLQLAGGPWIAAFLVDVGVTPSPTISVPAATPAPTPGSGANFVLIQQRLWDPIENGGALDGPSVHCGYGRRLVVNVLDANGNRINGVAVQALLGARETIVTGAQGKGDGVAEFVLGGGQEVRVIRDEAGRSVTSDVATGISTNPEGIPFETLIGANYCQDEATCQAFVANNGCRGHFSWTVTFQRR